MMNQIAVSHTTNYAKLDYVKQDDTAALVTPRAKRKPIRRSAMSESTLFGTQLTLFDLQESEITQRGVVYLVRSPGSKLTKIGFATDIKKRQAQYATHNGEKLEWLLTIKTDKFKSLERTLHARFESKRKQLEWFDLDDKDLVWIYRNIPGVNALDTKHKEWIAEFYVEAKDMCVITPFFRREFVKRRRELADPFNDARAIWDLFTTMLIEDEITPKSKGKAGFDIWSNAA